MKSARSRMRTDAVVPEFQDVVLNPSGPSMMLVKAAGFCGGEMSRNRSTEWAASMTAAVTAGSRTGATFGPLDIVAWLVWLDRVAKSMLRGLRATREAQGSRGLVEMSAGAKTRADRRARLHGEIKRL